MQQRLSLHAHIFRFFAAAIIVLSLAIGTLTAWNSSRNAYTLLYSQGLQSSTTLAANASLAILYESPLNIEGLINSIGANPSIEYLALFGLDQRALIEKGQAKDVFFSPIESAYSMHEDANAWYFSVPVYSEQNQSSDVDVDVDVDSLFLLPVAAASEHVGYVSLHISKAELKRIRLESFISNLLISLLMSSLLLYLLFHNLNKITGPLHQLAEAMGDVQDGHTKQAIDLDGPAELHQIANAFNQMLDAIDERDQKLRDSHESLEGLVSERTQDLEASNKELESFSYSVSHDLRAPLRSIDGFAKILEEDYYEILDDMGKDGINRIRRNAQKMGTLIDDMLKLSRLSRTSIKRQQTELNDLVAQAFAQEQELQPESQTQLINKPVPSVTVDKNLIGAVISNLISNAWKYSSKKVQPVIEFGVEQHAQHGTVFYIKDNGAGFNMEYASKLFSPFQRLHKASDFEGTGVGLATVARVIKRHGGIIWADAEVDNGATFYFTLPKQITNNYPP